MDNVSGNISKQWNKHHVIYMSNANMPREIIEKEFCVQFVSSSPHAMPMELMTAMRTSKAADEGIVAWDCRNNEEVAGNNPMHAEECSHAGLGCNYFCRTCKVGGTKEYKASTDGYQHIFSIKSSLLSRGTQKVKDATSATGIRDSTTDSIVSFMLTLGKQLRQKCSPNATKPAYGVDIHQDTPMEILHMLLLGVSKLMDIFQTRLASVSTVGLNDPTLGAEYICQYKGGLIGKHFKSLAQVMPYLVYDLVLQTVLDGWTTISALIVLLWHTEIDNTEAYLVSVRAAITNTLRMVRY
ncbi:hypothetical protein B0H21DRAFT_779613 [Amylocystis lapponica]|nr:hypothetical protein B0H21DRAFT_779613 [Amylocystis lapponica]